MEYSKKSMIFTQVMYTATWIVAVFSWLMWRQFPFDLVQYVTLIFGANYGVYCVKTCVENKAKIEKSHLDKLNGKI